MAFSSARRRPPRTRRRRLGLQTQPDRFIAQEVIALSTHPTFDGEGMYSHHVELRAFVHLRPDAMNGVTAQVIPAGLTTGGGPWFEDREFVVGRWQGHLDTDRENAVLLEEGLAVAASRTDQAVSILMRQLDRFSTRVPMDNGLCKT